MNDLLPANRLEFEIMQWNAKEESLKGLFKSSDSIERNLLWEKLRWYEQIMIKYGKTDRPEEQLVLQVIRREHGNIVKELYPKKWRQFIYKLLNLTVTAKLKTWIQDRNEIIHNKFLVDKLQQTGFKDALEKVKRYMKLGQLKFTVPVSYYVNEKEKINHSLHFKRDELGQYQFEGFSTSLYNDSKKMENRQHFFSVDEVNAKQAYELLSGRAILKQGTWKQLDLNEKDSDENFRIKEFPKSYGYSLETAMRQLPLKIMDELQFSALATSLKNGGREMVVLVKGAKEYKLFIEANPQDKGLNVYDENSKKISMVNVLDQKLAIVKKQKPVFELPVSKDQKRQVKSRSLKNNL